MTARIIDGAHAAKAIRDEVASLVVGFGEGAPRPGLATVLIGDDHAAEARVRAKRLACIAVGMQDLHCHLPPSVSQDEAAALVTELAADPAVSGIALQWPTPAHIDAGALLALIPPDKDVDGLTTLNIGRLAQGLPGLRPCTPAGVVRLLDEYEVPLDGAHAVVVSRSVRVGRPMAQLLLERSATVTICHSRTRGLADVCRRADILIAAAGIPRLIGSDAVRPGAIVIDVGVSRGENGPLGDVDYDAVAAVAGLITPNHGGVEPVTTAMLLANTLRAAQIRVGALAPSLRANPKPSSRTDREFHVTGTVRTSYLPDVPGGQGILVQGARPPTSVFFVNC